jgi:hypothetical protein
VVEAIASHLTVLNAEFDDEPLRGAAFKVPLRGFHGRHFTIHELRPASQPSTLQDDEKEKELWLTWPDVIAGLRGLLQQIKDGDYKFKRVVGIGRSGAIIGGILAGNIHTPEGHIPIDVCERTQLPVGARRTISTLTEPPETYVGGTLHGETRPPTQAWDRPSDPVLLVIGEAKTHGSFHSVQAWLDRRGVKTIKTLALVRGREARPDFYWFQAQNAWLPWQITRGYDLRWPTYQGRG